MCVDKLRSYILKWLISSSAGSADKIKKQMILLRNKRLMKLNNRALLSDYDWMSWVKL